MTHEEYKKKVFAEDPQLKAEYDALEPEYQLMKAVVEARAKNNLTQAELAEKIGTSQANISKLEHGELNPSINFLKRFADACDLKFSISFQ